MSKYPVEASDLDGVVAGVNYLLSGPQGLGQNFSGKSFGTYGYLTGSPRGPYVYPDFSGTILSVGFIDLDTSEMLDEVTYKFTFTTDLGYTPFYLGQPITVSDVTDETYNQQFTPIGVVECTSTYVIARQDYPVTVVSPSTGGTVSLNYGPLFSVKTDCQAMVTVTGATDRVFLSGQISFDFSYESVVDSQLNIYVSIERNQLINQGTQDNPSYQEINSESFFSQDYTYTFVGGDFGTKDINAIFTSFIDQDYLGASPSPGLYNYYLNILFFSFADGVDPPVSGPAIKINSVYAKTRTLTAQVVKQ